MKEYMKSYIESIDKYIEDNNKKNVDSVIEEHLIKINFFMHERLVHLLVTILFAVLTLSTFFCFLFIINFGILLIFLIFLVMLIFYIFHYYYLENSVQYMYKQYDKLKEIKNK